MSYEVRVPVVLPFEKPYKDIIDVIIENKLGSRMFSIDCVEGGSSRYISAIFVNKEDALFFILKYGGEMA